MEEFLPFADDMKEDVFRLLRSQPRKPLLWEWQYSHNPANCGRPNGLVLRVNGRTVGFNGIMTARASVDGRAVDAAWSVDGYVDAALRGQGLGKRLYALVEASAPIMLGYGMSDASFAMLTRRGWTFSTEVEEYYFQNRASDARALAKILLRGPSRNLWRRPSWKGELADIPASQLPSECDAAWQAVRSGYRRSVIRDFTYLKWKYGDHPSQRYRAILLTQGGRLQAVVIYRCDSQLGRLVDYLGPARDIGVKVACVRAFMDACKPAAQLHVVTTDPEFQSCLRRFGFRRHRERPRFAVLPTAVRLDRPADDWFLMTGDSDGDLIDAMM